jgi:hypothetical protein
MKVNNIATVGTSNPASEGGFDALLVSYMYGGSTHRFGEATCFWSSSFGNDKRAWRRGLNFDGSYMVRSNSIQSDLNSVRCKKD